MSLVHTMNVQYHLQKCSVVILSQGYNDMMPILPGPIVFIAPRVHKQ